MQDDRLDKLTLYDKNNQILKQRQLNSILEKISINPILSIPSKSGFPTLKYNNTFIHSSYSPVKEAKKLIQLEKKDTLSFIFVMGLGYGYHVQELLNQLDNKHCSIFLFEINWDIFSSAVYNSDLSFLEDERIHLFVGKDYLNKLYSILLSQDITDLKGTQTIYLQSEYHFFKTEYDQILNQINHLMKMIFQNQMTSLEFNKLWIKNLILNSIYLSEHNNLTHLYNQFKSKPALIVSAGPSLKNEINHIKQLQNQVLIFATDTSLSCLLEKDIIPDYVVSLDAQIHNFKDFITLENRSITVIYDLLVHPKIPKWVSGDHFYFVSVNEDEQPHPFIQEIEKKINYKIARVMAGSSVAVSAIEIARLLGCSPILLVGQDLSFSYNITHSISSPIYNQFLYNKSNRLNPIETQFYNLIQSRKLVQINEHANLKTDFILNNLNQWLSDYAKIYPNLLINTTSYGYPIKNIPNVKFENVVDLVKNNVLEKIKQDETNIQSEHDKKMIRKILSEYYSNFYLDLNSFFTILIKILNESVMQVETILTTKKRVEDIYPFLKSLYQKDDLWFNRKEKITTFHTQVYLNNLLSTTKKILNVVQYCIEKINQ